MGEEGSALVVSGLRLLDLGEHIPKSCWDSLFRIRLCISCVLGYVQLECGEPSATAMKIVALFEIHATLSFLSVVTATVAVTCTLQSN